VLRSGVLPGPRGKAPDPPPGVRADGRRTNDAQEGAT
jgi:hypothetical protein